MGNLRSDPDWLRRPLSCMCLVVVACVAIISTGCTKRSSGDHAGPEKKILRISQRNEPADLDPATSALPDDFFIIRALSEGLVAPVPSLPSQSPGNLTPTVRAAAADHWEISDDRLVYTFHLRPDARWSNNEPVTAGDFVASYRRLLTPSTGAPKAMLFFMVKNARAFATGELTDFNQVGFRAADPATLVVTLERPAPQFLLYAASGPWIPTHPPTVERFGLSWTRPENFVGNGPFTLTEWRPHQRIVVTRNPRYHDIAAVKLDEIQFVAFDNGDTEERAYRAGQIDVTMAVPPTKLDPAARERPAELHHVPLAETRYLTFNTTRPPLDDVRVRRALSLAIDRTKIVEGVLRGGHDAASRFVPPQLMTGATALGGTVALASDEARRLMAEAGFPNGHGFPRLELSTWPATPVVEAVQAMWQKELGIAVGLVTREAKVHLAALRDGNYDIGFMTAIPDVPDAAALLADLTTGAPGNYPHWSDPRYDALIAAAAESPNLPQQHALLLSAETRLLQESPLTPLYFNARNWLMSPRVRGWRDDALWTRFYLNVDVVDR